MLATMSLPLPFKVSVSAEKHIQALLIHGMPTGMERGITRTLAYESLNPAGELIEKFVGEHFTIGGDSPKIWEDVRFAVRATIAEHEFWIPRETMVALRGKTLTAKPHDVGYGRHAGTIRDLLVAT